MTTQTLDIIVSAATAAAIAGGSAIGIAYVANPHPGVAVWVLAGAASLVSAAKDVRSSLRLPPVPPATFTQTPSDNQTKTNP